MNLVSKISIDDNFNEGKYIIPFSFCKRNYNKGKCSEFYKDLLTKEKNKFYTCPYGLSVYLSDHGIYTCMRERSTYKKALAQRFSKENIFNPTMDAENFLTLIQSSCFISNEVVRLQEKEASIESISHEVKQLNSQIKEHCDVLWQTLHLDGDNLHLDSEDIDYISREIRTIYISSSMVSSRFSLYDYERNPASLKQGAVFPCNIYKKFDKIRKILKNYLKKSTTITIKGSSYLHFDAYPTFELVPLLIIENAVKYSYGNGGDVTINIFENSDSHVTVTITSYSPYCSEEDLSHIFEKGFRGKHANRISKGTGIGLYFVKMLCDIHNIDIDITSDSRRMSDISGIPYAPFTVKLDFTNAYKY